MEKEIFNGKVVRLTVEPQTINQKVIEFEKVYLPTSVHIFVLTDKRKIRLVKEERWDHGKKFRDKVVAGMVDKGESPLSAAKRELEEELGLVANKWEEFLISKQEGVVNDKRIYYIARDVQETIARVDDGENIIGHSDYTPEELFKIMLNGYFGTSPTAVAITQLYYKVKDGKLAI